jgi:hypothetical protein
VYWWRSATFNVSTIVSQLSTQKYGIGIGSVSSPEKKLIHSVLELFFLIESYSDCSKKNLSHFSILIKNFLIYLFKFILYWIHFKRIVQSKKFKHQKKFLIFRSVSNETYEYQVIFKDNRRISFWRKKNCCIFILNQVFYINTLLE